MLRKHRVKLNDGPVGTGGEEKKLDHILCHFVWHWGSLDGKLDPLFTLTALSVDGAN